MKWIFAAIYILILITQFPHVWAAYADIDRDGFQLFSMGAALAFELSIAIFTYRIVRGSRRKVTRWGVGFFIVLSAVANFAYYRAFGGLVSNVTPYLFSLALPASLALYAEEFGAEVRREERKKGAIESQVGTVDSQVREIPEMAIKGSQDEKVRNYQEFVVANSSNNGNGLLTVRELVEKHGIPQSTAYRWIGKYQKEHGNQ